MPSSTVKQRKVMSALAHGWKPSSGSVAKIPKKVAAEFHNADAGHKYGHGQHKIKKALHTARKYAKGGVPKFDDGGDTPDAAPDQPRRVYIYPGKGADEMAGPQTAPNDEPVAPAPAPATTGWGPAYYPGIAGDLTKQFATEGKEPVSPSLTSHQDTPREAITNFLKGPDTKSYEPRSVLADKAMSVLDWTPPMMAEQAGEDLAKGNIQDAAMFAMPGAKKAKGSAEFAFSLLHAAENPLSEYMASNPVAKKLKEQYPKDLASASVEYGYSPEQIDNIKTYMSPGAQAAFDKHYNKMAPPPKPATPWTATEIQATKPPPFQSGALNMDDLTKIEGPLGSNPGGVYQSHNGDAYYIKQGKTPDHVRNELIAADLYKAAGVPTLDYVPVQGGNHIATKWADKEKDNAYKFSPEEKAKAQEDFAVHAWLANHDVVGSGGDNLGIIGGKPTALDLGGALEYRAQGSPKKGFGNEVDELWSMRGMDPDIHNPDSEAMFGSITLHDEANSAKRVVAISDDKIRAIVQAHGGDPKLADKLIARKDYIASRYGHENLDPNYIEKYIKSKGDDYDHITKALEDEWLSQSEHDVPHPHENIPMSDEEIEAHYAKSAPTMDESYGGHDYDNSSIKGDFSRWSDVPPVNGSPYDKTVGFFRGLIYDGMKGKPESPVKPISNFVDWQLPLKTDLIKPTFKNITPDRARALGFNTNFEIVKGGHPDYPKELVDPKNKEDSAYSAEKALFMFPHDDMHQTGSYGAKSKPYVLRAEPSKAVEIYWPRLLGHPGFPQAGAGYNGHTMRTLIEAAHKEGIQVMFLHGMSDMGGSNQTQVLVLDTKATMRGTDAKFDPAHLSKWSLQSRYPLAGVAGTGLAASALSRQDDNGMKRGGTVAKKADGGGVEDANQNFAANQPFVSSGEHQYNTDLGNQEPDFQAWVKSNSVPFDPSSQQSDYDMRGFYQALQAGDPKASQALNSNDGLMHYPDYWKTPYHKSFSAESQWANPDTAPRWNDQDQLVAPDGRVIFDERAANKARGGKTMARKKEPDPKEHEFSDFSSGGLIDSTVPGRTDKHPLKVAAGSYVLPADFVSALGQNNTMAGADIVKKMFKSSAYGLDPMKSKSPKFHFDRMPKLADGGTADDSVKIIAAGGEIVLTPEEVKAVGHGDMGAGHKILDKLVLLTRKNHIKTLKKLKPPKK